MYLSENDIRQMVAEELTKPEVRSMIDDKFSSLMKEKEFKREIRNIAVEVLDDFFHEMWRKNGFWKNPLKNR